MSSMVSIPNGRYSVEMRSGKVIKIDEGFTNLLGYTEDDVKEGLVFKQFVPDMMRLYRICALLLSMSDMLVISMKCWQKMAVK